MPEPRTTLRRAADVRYRILDGEAVVIRQRANEVLGMNPVGARIFDLLDGKRTLDEIAGAIALEFDVPADTAHADVGHFLAELAGIGLVVPAGGGSAGLATADDEPGHELGGEG